MTASMSRESSMNASEAARYLGAHVETVRRLARRGDIPSFKVGKDWRFRPEALQRWSETQGSRAVPDLVLIIDDDPEVRRSIGRMVKRLGYKVLLASGGSEGLELVSREEPSLVLLDMRMDGMSGLEFLRELRKTHATLPVVIVTGFPDCELVHQAAEFPPILLISKPVEPCLLERTVQMVLGERAHVSRQGG
jgi:two-component system response regulator (stage 0 sporulation protein F)